MHHLILVREVDQRVSTGPCRRLECEGASAAECGCVFPERRRRLLRFGEIYRAVRETFGERVEITVVDPRNWFALLVLVLRDAQRYDVPLLTALRVISSNGVAAAIFDGQVLFSGEPPAVPAVIDLMSGRMVVHRA